MTEDADPLQLAILDVGHGNCTVIRDGKSAVVVDVPHGIRIAEILAEQGCSELRHLVLSHADSDHIGGVSQLLSDELVDVGTVWLNTDVDKKSKLFRDLLAQVAELRRIKRLQFSVNLNSSATGDLDFGRVAIEIIHPGIVRAGVGQAVSQGHPMPRMSTNGMSAVLRIFMDGVPCALLPGDVDAAGFGEIIDSGQDIEADVLVFPHHGGDSHGPSNEEFAREFASRVAPSMVVFSMGRRGPYGNPNLEVLKGVRRGAPAARIACTQISRHCHEPRLELSRERRNFEHVWPARGNSENLCCAGTIVVSIQNGDISHQPSRPSHAAFITSSITDPKCG